MLITDRSGIEMDFRTVPAGVHGSRRGCREAGGVPKKDSPVRKGRGTFMRIALAWFCLALVSGKRPGGGPGAAEVQPPRPGGRPRRRPLGVAPADGLQRRRPTRPRRRLPGQALQRRLLLREPRRRHGGDPMPVFRPGRRISKGLQNVQVSVVDGRPRVLSPGNEYPDFLNTGLEKAGNCRCRPTCTRTRSAATSGATSTTTATERSTWSSAPTTGPITAGTTPTTPTADGPAGRCAASSTSSATPARPPRRRTRPRSRSTAGGKPVEVFGWPSPNFADFDGDGDLDLLCGEFLDGFTYFENTGTRTRPEYAAGRRLAAPDGRPLVMDLEMITPTAVDWDRDGDPDLIVGDEDGRVAFVENTGTLARRPHAAIPAAALLPAGGRRGQVRGAGHAVRVRLGRGRRHRHHRGNTAGYIGFIENLSGPGVERPRWARPRLRRGRRQGDPHHGRPERQHPGAVRGQVGIHHAVGGRLGRRRPARPGRELDLGQGPVVPQRRHPHGAEARRRAADRGRVGRRRSRPWPGGGSAGGQGAAHAMAHHAGRRGLERGRPRRPRDARPRGLPRVLRAGAPRRDAGAAAPPAGVRRRGRGARCA